MATYHGILQNQIYPQPGFAPKQNDKGGWEATRQYSMRRTTWANSFIRDQFQRGRSITTFDFEVDSFYSFFKVESVGIAHEEGDIVTIEVRFNGNQFGAQYGESILSGDALPTYRLDGSLGEAPFSQHPKWKALSSASKARLGWLIDGTASIDIETGEYMRFSNTLEGVPLSGDIIGAITWDTAAGDELEFATRIQAGERTYKVPAITWTETTQGTSPMTSSQLNKIGKISTPRGNPPDATGSRNWMLISASQEQSGEFYQTSITWELSDSDGHDSFLYDT